MAIDPPTGDRPGRAKLRKLAQAAMNADQTVDQVESILGDMGPMMENLTGTMDDLNASMKSFDETIGRVNTSLDTVDQLSARMTDIMTRIERIVARAESVVGIGETALKPLGAIQATASNVAGLLRFGGGDDKSNGKNTGSGDDE